MDRGHKVALVSSGAVGAGMGQLGWKRRPDNSAPSSRRPPRSARLTSFELTTKACAGIAVTRLSYYLLTKTSTAGRATSTCGTRCAHCSSATQCRDHQRKRQSALMRSGSATTTALAAMVTNLLQAPLLVILSVVDGLYRIVPGGSQQPEIVSLVPQIDAEVLSLADAGTSSLGTGGMRSKLTAARQVTQAGGSVIIASGTRPDPLTRILAGETAGTLFLRAWRDSSRAKTMDRADRTAPRPLCGRRWRPAGSGIGLKKLARYRRHRRDRRIRERGCRRHSRPVRP